MTHASWNNERGRPSGPGHDNERLEYLGDAVLELVVGEYLFRRFPEYDEGQLTQLRAALVNTLTLARLAERLHLGEALLVGKGAAKTGARQLPSLQANAFEAMIGAIFLDQGYRVATRVFLQNIGDLAEWSDENFKGKLQEASQDRTGLPPTYRVSASSGPGHKREYVADAVVGGEVVGSGRGGTKQAAEQAAARTALETLTKQPKRRTKAPSQATRAARAARDAERSTAGEPPRVRRRVAEVAADRSVAPRRLERDTVPPLLPEQPAERQGRRRGLLGAIRSAAEALVGRVVPVEPEAPPPPPPAAEPVRRGGGGSGQRGGSRRPAGAGQRPAASGDAPAPGSRSRRRPSGGRAATGSGAGAPMGHRPSGTPTTSPTGTPAARGPRTRQTPAATTGSRVAPPAGGTTDGDETRRPARRGRRGGRGRRRPGSPGANPEAPAS
jgi:ribonuclease-3